MMLLTIIRGHPIEVGIAHHVSLSKETVRRIQGTALPRDESKYIATIHHQKMICAIARTGIAYFFKHAKL